MHFLRYAPLKEKLRTRTLTDREALPYLVVFIALLTATYWGYEQTSSTYSLLLASADILLAILGVLYAYRKNGGAAGHDLVLKTIVIGWVVTCRFVLFGIPLLLISGIVASSLGWSELYNDALDTVAPLLIGAILYQRTGHHIADTR